jgi:aryl-alcohol dehydrogenase-like predicted oxidoreductase
MEKRRLGKTGHMSSVLIFGSFALFRISQKEADTALEMALDNGINHIDVSPLYGQAEKHIGSWFKRNGKRFFLGCKTHERSKIGAWESLKQSLETLKVDRFDLFQLHGVDDIKTLNTVLGPGGVPDIALLRPLLYSPGQGAYFEVGPYLAPAFTVGKGLGGV